jgi:hypothetical protein
MPIVGESSKERAAVTVETICFLMQYMRLSRIERRKRATEDLNICRATGRDGCTKNIISNILQPPVASAAADAMNEEDDDKGKLCGQYAIIQTRTPDPDFLQLLHIDRLR